MLNIVSQQHKKVDFKKSTYFISQRQVVITD